MERLERLLTKTRAFDYFRTEDNLHGPLQRAVYGVLIESLLEKLTERQKAILNHKHFHQPDPNGYSSGREVSLLERLVNNACFFGMNGPKLSTEFYVYKPSVLGLEDDQEQILVDEIEAIQKIWGDRVLISYKNQHICFEIL